MSISTRVLSDGKELQISISGTFDFNVVQDFRKSYDGVGSYTRYVIDLAQVDHIDSSALGMLLNMRKTIGDSAPISIKNCKPGIKKIFLISRFDKKFNFE